MASDPIEIPDVEFSDEGLPVPTSIYARMRALDQACLTKAISAPQHKELVHTCTQLLRDYRAELRDGKIARLTKLRDELRALKLEGEAAARARAGGRAPADETVRKPSPATKEDLDV